jgi:hypothetical protein
MTRFLLVASIAMGPLAACGPTGGADGKFCDVARRLEASVDPLADAGVLADPVKLSRALDNRVTIYTALAAAAPKSASADATAVRDGLAKLRDALAADGFRSAAIDSDPNVKKAIDDAAVGAARVSLARSMQRACGVGTVGG